VRYNVFPDPSRGPNLYGTEPWHFYLVNLSLNFNILLPMALFSLPALAITHRIDRRRLGNDIPSPEQSSPFTLLALRLLPFYTWISIMSIQPHKEERFMYPVYPLVCFNAAVTTFLLRGWIEVAYIKFTKSPYRVCLSFCASLRLLTLVPGITQPTLPLVNTDDCSRHCFHILCSHPCTLEILPHPHDHRISV
jgi:alpha-1,2-mannosyltransferase